MTQITGTATQLATTYSGSGFTGLGDEAIVLTESSLTGAQLNTINGYTTGNVNAATITTITGLNANIVTTYDASGNGNGFSVLEIIKACESITRMNINYQFVNKRKSEPEFLVADSSKAISELKWKIVHSDIEDIIKSAWRWHRRLYSEII